jgi:phosphatidylserine/phosphatidylglycerophosphate/cardiolipin synthase-like enzyme
MHFSSRGRSMIDPLLKLTDSDLRELAAALRSGRLSQPYTTIALRRFVSEKSLSDAHAALENLEKQGFLPLQIGMLVDMILKERAQHSTTEELIDLVMTGPEGSPNRDTAVVVRELFASAINSVLVAGYAVYQGNRVFKELADRMEERPKLEVKFCLDIQRGRGDTTDSAELVRRFSKRFRDAQWPEKRKLPQIYYFPASLVCPPDQRVSLHAKCIVVDRKVVFVSSANFTEAAQERNIEIGVLIRSALIADQLSRHFETLIATGMLWSLVT